MSVPYACTPACVDSFLMRNAILLRYHPNSPRGRREPNYPTRPNGELSSVARQRHPKMTLRRRSVWFPFWKARARGASRP